MAKSEKEKVKKMLKKKATAEVEDKLMQVFGNVEKAGSKKFKRSMKKATKLFVPFILSQKLAAIV